MTTIGFPYVLPTTGNVSMQEFFAPNAQLQRQVSDATAFRGRLRAALKDHKLSDKQDFLNIQKAVEDYIPMVLGLAAAVESSELRLINEVETTWRCTLSNLALTSKQPRVKQKSIYYELIFTMLTLGYVLMDRANEYAHSTQRKILIAIGDLSAYAAGDGSSIVGSSSPMTATASVASSASGLGSGISGPKSSKPSAASRLFKKSSSTSGSSSSKGSKSNSNTIGEFTDYLTDEDLARIDQQLTMAADLYCRAAGVFEYIAQELIPRWNSSLVVLPKATDGSDVAAAPGGKVQSESSRPVDVQSCFVSAQIRLALAEAHACTVRKASIKAARASAVRQASSTTGTSPGSSGSGTGSKASYVLLAKISIGVKEEYERAYGLLKSVKDLNEISTDFRNHVKDGKLYYEALAQTLLGMDAYESQQYGKAIGFMSVARASFATLTKSKSSFHTIAQVASFEYRLASERCLAFEKINDSVTFEKVPTPTELLAVMPSGRDLLAVKKYQVPRPAFGVPVSGNGSGLGAAGEDDVNQIAYALQGAYF